MPSRCNKHIRKFNQLLQVYEPATVSEMELVDTRMEAGILEHKDEIRESIQMVEALTVESFFTKAEQRDIANNDSLPDPATVAQNHREEMLERLREMEAALEEALADSTGIDASKDLTL